MQSLVWKKDKALQLDFVGEQDYQNPKRHCSGIGIHPDLRRNIETLEFKWEFMKPRA